MTASARQTPFLFTPTAVADPVGGNETKISINRCRGLRPPTGFYLPLPP